MVRTCMMLTPGQAVFQVLYTVTQFTRTTPWENDYTYHHFTRVQTEKLMS